MRVELNENYIELEKLPWDTEVLGYHCAKLTEVHCNDAVTLRELINRIRGWDIEHVIARVNDIHTAILLQQVGFMVIDGYTDWQYVGPMPQVREYTFSIRESYPDDEINLCNLACTMYDVTRFYTDPHNTKDMANAVYYAWMHKCFHGWSDRIHVAEKDGQIVGYSTCRTEGDHGIIDITGVSSAVQGLGIGSALLRADVVYFQSQDIEKITVATQLSNKGAIALHQKCGFKLVETKYTLCRWVG